VCTTSAIRRQPSFWRREHIPKLDQELLGHSTVALTLNTYSHLTAGLSGEAAKTMDRVLRASPASAVTTIATEQA
jgi:integrase